MLLLYKNIQKDAETVYSQLSVQYSNIGVWGMSIGGLPATNLVSKFSEIKLVIFDKNFSSIELTIEYSLSKSLSNLYNYFWYGSSETADKYLNNKSTKKVILADNNDEIIPNLASLKSGVSRSFVKRKFYSNSNKANSMSLLKFILNDIEYVKFVNSLGNILENRNYINMPNYAITEDSKTNIDQSNEDNINEVDFKLNNITLTESNENLLSSKDKSKGSRKVSSRLGSNNVFENDSYLELKEYIESLDAGANILTNISDLKDNEHKINFINVFFEDLYVWGSYEELFDIRNCDKDNKNDETKDDSINNPENNSYNSRTINRLYKDFSNREFRKNSITKLNELKDKVTKVLEDLKLFNNELNSKKSKVLETFRKGIERVILFYYNNQIDENEDGELGILVPIDTGHNGVLRQSVLRIISDCFLKAKLY